MVDNDEQELSSIQEDNNNTNKTFQNDINEFNEQIPTYSTITGKTITLTAGPTVENLSHSIDNKSFFPKIPYPYGDEVPFLKLKNEDYYTSGKEIQFYEIIEEDIFSRCNNCRNNNNEFFCKNCKINLCHECLKNCQNHQGMLINLDAEKEDFKKNKIILEKLFFSTFYLPKKIEKNPNVKNPPTYDVVIEDDEKNAENKNMSKIPLPDTNDFKFIRIIKEKNYNNYFHYQNIKNCINYISNRYENVFEKPSLKIEYNIDNLKKNGIKDIRIFGKDFAKKYKEKISLIINNEKSELLEIIKLDDDYLEVILVQNSTHKNEDYITDMSCMFSGCEASKIMIDEVKNRKLLDLGKVTDISSIFKGCTNLESIDLKYFEKIYNVNKMNSLFYRCKNLVNISNLESLKTKDVTKMDRMFCECEKLKDLNGIQFFNTEKVKSFFEIFLGCTSLKALPDISQWNMEKANDLSSMFKDCANLTSLPDISNWNLKKVEKMNKMFSGCNKL